MCYNNTEAEHFHSIDFGNDEDTFKLQPHVQFFPAIIVCNCNSKWRAPSDAAGRAPFWIAIVYNNSRKKLHV